MDRVAGGNPEPERIFFAGKTVYLEWAHLLAARENVRGMPFRKAGYGRGMKQNRACIPPGTQ